MDIKYLVIGGGGLRFAAQFGSCAALELAGVMPNLKAIAGSSLGAITASLLAVGCDSTELYQIFNKLNVGKLMGSKTVYKPYERSGQPLYELINSQIKKKILIFFDSISVKNLNFSSYISDLLYRCRSPNGIIRFSDFTTLHSLYPKNFKQLVVTVIDGQGNLLHLSDFSNSKFNALNLHNDFRDTEVALACRASASLPIIFKEVKLGGKILYDGGIYQNVPFDAIFNSMTLHLKSYEKYNLALKNSLDLLRYDMRSKSFLVYFSQQSQEQAHKASLKDRFVRNELPAMLSRLKLPYKNTDMVAKNNQELAKYFLPQQKLRLEIKDIFFTNFSNASRTTDELYKKGFDQCHNHLRVHAIGNPIIMKRHSVSW